MLTVLLELSVAAIYVGNWTAYYASSTITSQVLSKLVPTILDLVYGRKVKLEYGPWNLGKYRHLINITAVIIYLFIRYHVISHVNSRHTGEHVSSSLRPRDVAPIH